MRCSSKVYQQMPHQMVITKSLHSIEDSTDGIEHSAQSDKEYKLPRGVTQKEREEEDYGPTHDKIYRQADGRYGASAERLIKNTEDNHHPLQDEDKPTLPATDDGQCYGSVTARYGYIYKYMVEDMKNLLVTRVM